MSLRGKQHFHLDTEAETHTGMEFHSRSSHKYLLLQVWCFLLTVAMVILAALLSSIKVKSTEDEVSTLKPDVSPAVNTLAAPLISKGSPFSYIQLIRSPVNSSWQALHSCDSCSLVLRGNSIHCSKDSLYFIYAQVTFSKYLQRRQDKSVILIRNARFGRSLRKLVEGLFPQTAEGSVWVAQVVKLTKGESVSIDITGDFLTDNTFWGAYQLH